MYAGYVAIKTKSDLVALVLSEADATHIVKCVNLHDELVENLSEIIKFYSGSFPNVIRQSALEIIAKAKGDA